MRWILAASLFLSFMSTAQTNLEWSFLHPIKKEWLELGTHGSVQEALIATGELPDPFYGTNEEKFGWIENHLWEFKCLLSISSAQFSNEFIELEFPSLDTYAQVYINDSLVLSADNAFIPHRIQIKKFVKHGVNEIDIVFTPPIIYHAKTKEKVGYQLPAPNDNAEISIAPYVRKPQYQFGWDWALRMNTIGLNKPAILHTYNVNRLIGTSVNTLSISEKTAELEISAQFSVPVNGTMLWESQFFGSESVESKNGRLVRRVRLENPQLWWPRGQGEQKLYQDVWYFGVAANSIAEKAVDFGVRTSELIVEPDQWGTSYYFKINGRRIFAKGGDYIPQEIFPARVKDEDIVKMVEDMAAANFNMVRVWGGGYYPDEVFFNTCDELGLMVWEDLMFACAMYPGDSAFLANIRREFEYQVPRIAAHPSVVLFNGNNEVEVAWGNWGFQIKHGLYGKSAKEIEDAYDAIFKKTAPEVIAEHTTVPYIHTSPLSNWGKPELYNHGSQHYWGVWHGKDPIEDFGKKIGRFNAEYGFQSFPEFNSLLSFSQPSEWDLSSVVMKHHQKSYVGNDMILKQAKRLYGTPANFEEFIYFSQLTQSMAVSMAVAGHRLDAPRCGGTLYWQVNDCWPAPTWSSIDYFNNWKALHYRVRDDYNDVAVLEKFDDLSKRTYFLISDAPDTLEYEVNCKILDLKGKVLAQKVFTQTLGYSEKIELKIDEILGKEVEDDYIIYFTYEDNQGKMTTRSFDHLKEGRKKPHARSVELSLCDVNLEEKTAQLEIKTTHFLKNAWISSSAFGLRYDRNFVHLMPGKHRIQISFETSPNQEDFRLMWQ